MPDDGDGDRVAADLIVIAEGATSVLVRRAGLKADLSVFFPAGFGIHTTQASKLLIGGTGFTGQALGQGGPTGEGGGGSDGPLPDYDDLMVDEDGLVK